MRSGSCGGHAFSVRVARALALLSPLKHIWLLHAVCPDCGGVLGTLSHTVLKVSLVE
jgi:hypothetical protein